MEGEKEAVRVNMAVRLKDMADSELYSWDNVRAFHELWLNQMEQGRVCWDDEDTKL